MPVLYREARCLKVNNVHIDWSTSTRTDTWISWQQNLKTSKQRWGATLHRKTWTYLRFRNLPGGEPLEEWVLSLEGGLLLDGGNSSRELHCRPQLHPPLVALCPAITNPSIQNEIRLTKPVVQVKRQVALYLPLFAAFGTQYKKRNGWRQRRRHQHRFCSGQQCSAKVYNDFFCRN